MGGYPTPFCPRGILSIQQVDMTNTKPRVTIEIDNQKIECPAESMLLNVIIKLNLKVETACGGNGICQLCRVTITEGGENLAPPSLKEARALGNILLDKGVRLSCQVRITHPIKITLPKYESPEERRRRKEKARARTKK